MSVTCAKIHASLSKFTAQKPVRDRGLTVALSVETADGGVNRQTAQNSEILRIVTERPPLCGSPAVGGLAQHSCCNLNEPRCEALL